MDYQTFKFIAVAGILYAIFHFSYHQIPDEVLSKKIYPTVIGHPTALIINTITPDRNVQVNDQSIISKKAKMNIVRGCDGSGVWFMLSAAIIGFGAKMRETLIGLFFGTITVYLINQVRIAGLYYIIEYNRSWFQPVHVYYAPTLIIFLIAVFFLFWTRWVTNENIAS